MNSSGAQNLEFLHTSYTNVQGVLRFLDTKAGIIFALAGALVAAAISTTSPVAVAKITTWADFKIVHFSILGGMISLSAAVVAIWPAYGPKDREQFAWLYPALHPGRYRGEDAFKIPKFTPFCEDELMEQYRRQLEHLARVLIRKTRAVRWSLGALVASVILLAIDHLS